MFHLNLPANKVLQVVSTIKKIKISKNIILTKLYSSNRINVSCCQD